MTHLRRGYGSQIDENGTTFPTRCGRMVAEEKLAKTTVCGQMIEVWQAGIGCRPCRQAARRDEQAVAA